MRARRSSLAGALALTWLWSAPGSSQEQAPARVTDMLSRELKMTDAQIASVRQGVPVAVNLPRGVDREIGVAGAVRISAPASRLVEVVRDIEKLERGGGFLATRKFSSPPVAADVATLRLPDQDVAALRRCRPGKCDVKLGQQAFDQLARIDWTAADATEQANGLARRMALEYVENYRAGGNRALAVYRDTPRPVDIAAEFADMVTRTSGLLRPVPEVSAYLLAYPEKRPASAEDFFYWSLAEFGLKPVVRLNHVVIHATGQPTGLQYAITTKQLYASHYFHTALEVRALVDDPEQPGRAHYLLVLNLARSDGLTGMFGSVVAGKARTGARKGLQSALGAMKQRAERGA